MRHIDIVFVHRWFSGDLVSFCYEYCAAHLAMLHKMLSEQIVKPLTTWHEMACSLENFIRQAKVDDAPIRVNQP